MRIRPFAAVLALALAHAGASAAQTQPEPGFRRFALGAYASFGIAWQLVDAGELPYAEPPDPKPRFAGGGGAYLDFYPARLIALEAGVGFVGKGRRDEGHTMDGADMTKWTRVIYMEIPLGAKLNVQGFEAGVALGLEFALSGRTVTESGDERSTHEWFEGPDYEGEPGDWDYYRRFNLCPRITLAYAIPVGPVAIVPGVTWMIEALNTVKGAYADDYGAKARNMNLMFNLGVEYGFGGGG